MDYRYIEQLLERYWLCETSLEEEQILRTFFSQENVPVCLLPYKDLFTYEHTDTETNRLGEDFDRKMLEMVGEMPPVKAKTISLKQRLTPLFKAAAIVAIILTLGNAIQVAMQPTQPPTIAGAQFDETTQEGNSIAIVDTTKIDSMKMAEVPILK